MNLNLKYLIKSLITVLLTFGCIYTPFGLCEEKFVESDSEKNNKEAPKKVKIKYMKHTEVNLNENTIDGEIKMPQIFYIFQRKRSQGHHIITPPQNFIYQKLVAKKIMKDNFYP